MILATRGEQAESECCRVAVCLKNENVIKKLISVIHFKNKNSYSSITYTVIADKDY